MGISAKHARIVPRTHQTAAHPSRLPQMPKSVKSKRPLENYTARKPWEDGRKLSTWAGRAGERPERGSTHCHIIDGKEGKSANKKKQIYPSRGTARGPQRGKQFFRSAVDTTHSAMRMAMRPIGRRTSANVAHQFRRFRTKFFPARVEPNTTSQSPPTIFRFSRQRSHHIDGRNKH